MFLHGNYITVHLWGKKKEKEITQKPKLLETKVIIKWAQGFFFFFSSMTKVIYWSNWNDEMAGSS